ncbi:DUF5615 family PIN-like protein [Haladaptatus sp. NG-WS-4]
MSFRVLLDENVERQAMQMLTKMGHDTEMVVDVDELGPGTDDATIAAYAKREDRLVLTVDDDFLTEIDETDHAGVLFQVDDRLTAHEVASIVDVVATHLDQSDIDGKIHISKNWL